MFFLESLCDLEKIWKAYFFFLIVSLINWIKFREEYSF